MISRLLCKAILVAVLLVAGVALANDITQEVLAQFGRFERLYGIPDGILAKFAKVESHPPGNANSYNSSSGATGLFQWIPKYWYEFTRQVYGYEMTIQDAKNPGIAGNVTAIRIKQAQNRLGPLIRQSIGEQNMSVGLYLEHFLGEAGARKFLSLYIQNPGGSATAAFPKAAAQNPKWFGNCGNCTFAQVVNEIATEFKGPGVEQITGYAGPVTDVPSPESSKQRLSDPTAPEPQVDYPTDYGAIFREEQAKWESQNPNNIRKPNQQGAPCPVSTYCVGYALVRQEESCDTTLIETCTYGCSGSRCVPRQDCPQGSIMQNGQCVRLPGQQSQQSQPLGSAFSQQPSSPQGPAGGGQASAPQGFPTSNPSFNSISSILQPENTRLPEAATGTPAYDLIVALSGGKPAFIAQSQSGGTGGENARERQQPSGLTFSAPRREQPGGTPGGTQTFTSEDLRDNFGTTGNANSHGTVASFLVSLKNLLLDLLAVITPH